MDYSKKISDFYGNTDSFLAFSEKNLGLTSAILRKTAEKNTAHMRTMEVSEHREFSERLALLRAKLPKNIAVEQFFCSVPTECIRSTDSRENGTILYIHGGSWAFGSLNTARPVAALLANVTGCKIIVPQYRLSPEFPFPSALDDCMSAYLAILQTSPAQEKFAIFGDSAGGNLALCLTRQLLDLGLPTPIAMGLASPVTDLRQNSNFVMSKTDLLYTQHSGSERTITELYHGEISPENEYISPVTASLKGFPPILIHAGAEESIAYDCYSFAKKAHQEGVAITLKIWMDMYHDFSILGPPLAESARSLSEFASFFRTHL